MLMVWDIIVMFSIPVAFLAVMVGALSSMDVKGKLSFLFDGFLILVIFVALVYDIIYYGYWLISILAWLLLGISIR